VEVVPWRRAEEDPPPKGMPVVTLRQGGTWAMSYWDGVEWFAVRPISSFARELLDWRALPEPPEWWCDPLALPSPPAEGAT